MVADAAVSLGVVLGGLAILWTGANWIDPVLSLFIAAVIVWGTWGPSPPIADAVAAGRAERIAVPEVRSGAWSECRAWRGSITFTSGR